MGLTLGKKYKTRRGEGRLVGVSGDWLIWQPKNTEAEGLRFRTKREGVEVRAPRRGTVEVKT